MFKAPFSFDGRIRRIEYFLSGIIGGIVFGVAYSLGLATLFLGAAAGSAGGSLLSVTISIIIRNYFPDRVISMDSFIA